MQRWRRVLVLVPGMLVLALLVAILVPFFLYGKDLEAWAGTLLRPSASPVAAASVVFLLLAADIVLPLPSSLIATAAGAQLGWGLGTVTVFAGLTAGHATGYALGHVVGRRAMIYARGTEASGNFPEPSAVPGMAVVVATRAVPVLAEAICVACGAAAMPFRRFLLSAGAANLALALAYAWLGQRSVQANSVVLLFVLSVAVPLAGIAVWQLWTRTARGRGTSRLS